MDVTPFDYGTKLTKDTSPASIPSGTAVASFNHRSATNTWNHYTAFLQKNNGTIHIEAVTDDVDGPATVSASAKVNGKATLEAVLSDVVKELSSKP